MPRALVDEVERDFHFGAAELGIARNEAKWRQAVGIICARNRARRKFFLENVIAKPVHEHAKRAGRKSRAASQAEVEAEGTLVAQAGRSDFVRARAAVRAV